MGSRAPGVSALIATWLVGCILGVPSLASEGPPRCNLGGEVEYGVGESATFCVYLSTKPVRKMIFRIKVDEHSTMMLRGSQKMTVAAGQHQPVYTWIAGTQPGEAYPLNCADAKDVDARGHTVSCPQVYATGSHVAHVLNLVVNLDGGKLASFAWDNSCSACGPASCMESSKDFDVVTHAPGFQRFPQGVCGEDTPKCPPGAENECDMKIFVTWAGTDRDGRNLLSAGMRLSKFTGMTLKSVFDTMKENYNALAPSDPVIPSDSAPSAPRSSDTTSNRVASQGAPTATPSAAPTPVSTGTPLAVVSAAPTHPPTIVRNNSGAPQNASGEPTAVPTASAANGSGDLHNSSIAAPTAAPTTNATNSSLASHNASAQVPTVAPTLSPLPNDV